MAIFKKILTYVVYISFAFFLIAFGLSLFIANEDTILIYQILTIVFFSISIISLIVLFFTSPNHTLKEAKRLYKANKSQLISYVKANLKEENMKLLLQVKKEDDYFIVENGENSFSITSDKEEKEEILFLLFSLIVKKNFCSRSLKSFIFYFKNGFFKFKEPYQNTQIVDFSIINEHFFLNKYIMNITHEENLNYDWRTYSF